MTNHRFWFSLVYSKKYSIFGRILAFFPGFPALVSVQNVIIEMHLVERYKRVRVREISVDRYMDRMIKIMGDYDD